MIDLERKVKILTISTILVLAVLSGIAAIAYANRATNGTDLMSYAYGAMNDASNVTCGYPDYYGGMRGSFGRHPPRWGCGGPITVSQEFKDNVINITEGDPDVQELLSQGYNITEVRPIINTVVEADGTVTTKATDAIVTLLNNTTGRAIVWVNMEQAKVTRIEIISITVIDKSST